MLKLSNLFKIFFLIFLLIAFNQKAMSQNKLSVGFYGGGGVISGNFPSLGSFTSSIFIEGDPGIFENINFRLNFLYNTDFNILLPKENYRYSSFVKGLSLSAIATQKLNPPFYVEEGIGPLVLNDRTYSGISEWDYGLAFSVLFGLDFRKDEPTGFRLGAGTSYGLTISNTYVRYLSLHLQLQYML